jgi:hypothetical protein
MDTTPTPAALKSTTPDNMRTEAEFIAQAELARTALQQFVAVKDFDNADETKHIALNKLMKTTVGFSNFCLSFSSNKICTSSHLMASSSLLTTPYSSKSHLRFTKSLLTFITNTRPFRSRTIFTKSTVFVIASMIISRIPMGRKVNIFFLLLFFF